MIAIDSTDSAQAVANHKHVHCSLFEKDCH